MKRLPNHMKDEYGTLHGFRVVKREQVREALKSCADLRRGCALTPAHKEIVDAINALERARRKMSVEQWGK